MTRDPDTAPATRLLLAALIYARREFTYQIDRLSFMLVTDGWIPIEGAHEIALIQELTDRSRRFVKPQRYDAKPTAPYPSALLLDTGPTPTPLYVVSAFTDAKSRSAREKAIKATGVNQWIWHTDHPIPAFPPPTARKPLFEPARL